MNDESAIDSELVKESICPACLADIVVYADATGLLPDEHHGDRRATHSWLVCELRQRINDMMTQE